jgi:hypothetical protein
VKNAAEDTQSETICDKHSQNKLRDFIQKFEEIILDHWSAQTIAGGIAYLGPI